MRAAGHLRHHTAEPNMQLHAGGDGVGEQCLAADDAYPRLIA
jgi:hypothetical protein